MSFGYSVGHTRLILALAAYPKIGNAQLHIAHVLWGGLAVFLSSILMLVLSNQWVYSLSAILTGVGMGLFIDEVGKFITQSNNYFYPAAAPIIYVVFLLTTRLYLRIRRPPAEDPRAVMYRALEGLSELLDVDLESREAILLRSQLDFVEEHAESRAPVNLARAIRSTLSDESVPISPTRWTLQDRRRAARDRLMDCWIPEGTHRIINGAGLIMLGLLALRTTFKSLRAIPALAELEQIVSGVLNQGMVAIPASPGIFSAWISLESAMGVALFVAAVVLLFQRDRLGTFLGQRTLVAYLAFVNVFVFYFQ